MRFDDDSGGGYDAPSDFQRLQLEPGSGGSSWGVPETVTHAHGDHMGHRGGDFQGAGTGASPLLPHSEATTTGRPSALNLLSMHGPMSEGSVEDLLGSGMDGFDWGGLSGGGDGEGGEEEQGWMVLGGMGGGGTSFHAGLVRRLVEQVEQVGGACRACVVLCCQDCVQQHKATPAAVSRMCESLSTLFTVCDSCT